MTLELLLTLAALALVDSLSVGTLLIPVFFLIAPRLRAGRLLVYLLTIAGFYLVVGLLLLWGATAALAALQNSVDPVVGSVVQLVAGTTLLLVAIAMPTKPRDPGSEPGRLARWRDRALNGSGPGTLIGVALVAGALELATMVPYLGAVGLLTAAPVDDAARVGMLAAYCLVMIAPALVLLVLRIAARRLVEPALARFGAWLERTGAENTAWILGIVGFLLARGAANDLGLFEAVGEFFKR